MGWLLERGGARIPASVSHPSTSPTLGCGLWTVVLGGRPHPRGSPGQQPEHSVHFCRGCGDRLRWRWDAGPHLVPWRIHGSAAVCLPGESGVRGAQEPRSPARCGPLGLGWMGAEELGFGLTNGHPEPAGSKKIPSSTVYLPEGLPGEPLCLPLPSTGTSPETILSESIGFPPLSQRSSSSPFPPLLFFSSFSSLSPSPALGPRSSTCPTDARSAFSPPAGLQQQLAPSGATDPVWGLCQGGEGRALHQEERGPPEDHRRGLRLPV